MTYEYKDNYYYVNKQRFDSYQQAKAYIDFMHGEVTDYSNDNAFKGKTSDVIAFVACIVFILVMVVLTF